VPAAETGAAACPQVILEAVAIEAGYGRSRVLFGISLAVLRGEVVALLGRNGAGKSTTLKAIMGLVPVTKGSVLLTGEEVTGRPPHVRSRMGMGYVPQGRRIFPGLTVRENLVVAEGSGRSRPRRFSLERVLEAFPALRGLERRLGGSLSGGEQQMLAIARTLMGDPRLLLLDEPTEGLAPLVVEGVAEQVHRLRREGMTILLAEQNLRFAMEVSDRVYILEKGVVKSKVSVEEIIKHSTSYIDSFTI
jgi:branched-chain amino acid transport system ATP-binding protein